MSLQKDSRMHNRQYLIPELDISANDCQLKQLKKKMLANYYDKQINEKKVAASRIANPQDNANRINYKDINQFHLQYQRAVKKQLAQQYQQEMLKKQELKQYQRKKSILDEYERLNKISTIEEYQKQKLRANAEMHKQEMRSMMERSQSLREAKQRERRKEQEQFNHRYSPEKPINGKYNYFRNYYDKLNEAQHQIQKNYIEKWQPLIKQRQRKRYSTNSSPKLTNDVVQQQISQHHAFEQRLRKQWRKSLDEQIRQRQNHKLVQRKQRIHNYTDQNYQNRHHPINNPIDFKITHDNKYIIRQLTADIPQMSRLAHSGSQVLLS